MTTFVIFTKSNNDLVEISLKSENGSSADATTSEANPEGLIGGILDEIKTWSMKVGYR